MQHIKHIPMDGPKNFRDIGGYMNIEGRLVAWNRLYRSDGLSALSERDEKMSSSQLARHYVSYSSSHFLG